MSRQGRRRWWFDKMYKKHGDDFQDEDDDKDDDEDDYSDGDIKKTSMIKNMMMS